MTETATGRLAFVTSVRDALDAAGVEYAFLHNLDGTDQRDSDVDIVVDRDSLDVLETVVRTGALGRLVQRVDYDIPWCRCYILDMAYPQRRFRQLDVACDPFGIGRYGDALRRAFARRERIDGWPMLGGAEAVVYLAAKRACKGVRYSEDVGQLRTAYAGAPTADGALADAFGETGMRLARSLAHDEAIDGPLREIAAIVVRQRLSRLGLRGWFETTRVLRRINRPTGLVVVLAGPDGTGKSTLAAALEPASEGLFRRVSRLHLTPGLLPPPARLLGRASGDVTQPHARTASGRAASLARVAYLATDTLLGWGPRVSMPRIRSGLVVIERGWRDLEVDPRRYRLSAGAWAVRALGRILPRADLTLVLGAPSAQIHARKPELAIDEIERQQTAWQEIASRDPAHFAAVQTSTPDEARTSAVDAIADRLATRARTLDRFGTAITCLGSPRFGGTEFAVLSAGGRPRWIVPRRRGAPGPSTARLYRPASTRHHVGAALLDARARLGTPGAPKLVIDTSLGLGPELAELLGLDEVDLAALLPTDPARTQRTVLSVLHRGRPMAIAKVAPRGSAELEQELGVLAALEVCALRMLEPPRLLGSFAWRGLDVLVAAVLETNGRTDRPLGAAEEDALVELASLGERLGPVLGGEGTVPVHGDFCGWNSAAHRGRLRVWDWEWAHLGEPLEDWFHWRTQRLVHFGRGTPSELVDEALAPSAPLRSLCNRLGIEAGAAPTSLAASLRRGLVRLEASGGPGVELRRQALTMLEGTKQ